MQDIKEEFNALRYIRYHIAPIAESAAQNLNKISKMKDDSSAELYYFAVGHYFKSMDKNKRYKIFDIKYNEKIDKYEANRFKTLYNPKIFKKDFAEQISDIITNFRNFNSHGVHDFSKLKLSEYSKEVNDFVRESFRFAIIDSVENVDIIIDENRNINEQELLKQAKKLFSFELKNKEITTIDDLLFIQNNDTFEYKLFDDYAIFNVEKGTYYSKIAEIFLLSMFLYKDDAETLISKITGFKINNDKKKRNIFTIFAKKFSSSDVDNENLLLVKFRDIINYLNHYPTPWNNELQNNTDDLSNKLREIYNADQKDKDSNKNNKNSNVKENKNDIDNDTLFATYARNNDRFMFFACEYIARKEYFGNDAQFKMYKYYTTDEQNEALKTEANLDKLKYHNGKVVYFSTYSDFTKQHPNWQNGSPFVFENNAIQIKLNNGTGAYFSIQRNLLIYFLEQVLFYEHRNGKDLMQQYFKQLDNDKKDNKCLLDSEKNENINKEEHAMLLKLFPKRLVHKKYATQCETAITINSLKKILQNAENEEAKYEERRKQKEEADAKINAKKPKRQSTLLADFKKKNKGKRFKLMFIHKAWNLMYFREIYKAKRGENKHSKSLNITKEEFNDFCRYMYAFDKVEQYKQLLQKMLEPKGFFGNEEFKQLFDSNNNLDDMYGQTKDKFNVWCEKQEIKHGSYDLQSYQHIVKPEKNITYINLSHFINFLKTKKQIEINNNGGIKYKALENAQYLIKEFYAKSNSTPQSNNKKLHNALNSIYLEDCLLYEIAFKYLLDDTEKDIKQNVRDDDTEKDINIKKNVRDIFAQNINFYITDNKRNKLYTLCIPFKKIDSYIKLKQHKEEQENNYKGTSFLANIDNYLTSNCPNLDNIKTNYCNYKTLQYANLLEIYKNIINNATPMANVILRLEEYYVYKNKLKINENENRISFNEIKDITTLYGDILNKTRNKVFHFGIPDCDYSIKIEDIKNIFKKAETDVNYKKQWEKIIKLIDNIKKNYNEKQQKNE